MAKLTDISCEYTDGGIYVFTALLNDDVWFMTDFETYDSYGCYDAPLDVVEADILPDGHINYDGHWKDPSFPLPQWIDILNAVKDTCGQDVMDDVYKRLPANAYCRVGEKGLPTEDIRTYTVGSGEITLTAQDAEELRRLLQFEYIEHCINEVIDSDPSFFHFTSEHNRPAFVRKVAERYDDIVDIEGGYFECLDEDVTYVACRVGVTDADDAVDDREFSGFWKE